MPCGQRHRFSAAIPPVLPAMPLAGALLTGALLAVASAGPAQAVTDGGPAVPPQQSVSVPPSIGPVAVGICLGISVAGVPVAAQVFLGGTACQWLACSCSPARRRRRPPRPRLGRCRRRSPRPRPGRCRRRSPRSRPGRCRRRSPRPRRPRSPRRSPRSRRPRRRRPPRSPSRSRRDRRRAPPVSRAYQARPVLRRPPRASRPDRAVRRRWWPACRRTGTSRARCPVPCARFCGPGCTRRRSVVCRSRSSPRSF